MGSPLPPNYILSLELITEKMTANYTTNEILIELSFKGVHLTDNLLHCVVHFTHCHFYLL